MNLLPLLLLAMCSCSAVRLGNDNKSGAGEYHNNAASSSILKLLTRESVQNDLTNDLTYIDAKKIVETRRGKRAPVSFANAWNAVLKSTLGFTMLRVAGKSSKLFVIVGSNVDATKDFYSLGPTTVTILPSGLLSGVVGHHLIGLRVNEAPNRPVLYVLNRNKAGEFLRVSSHRNVKKIIRYYENNMEAKAALGRWQVFSSVQ